MPSAFNRHTRALIGLLIALSSCSCLFAGKEFLAGPGERVVPDQLLIGLQPGADIQAILAALAPRALVSLVSRERNTYLLRLPPGVQASTSKLLAAHPSVNYVEPNRIRHIAVVPPNDSLMPQQWGLTAIFAQQAWDYFPNQYLTAATASTTRVKVAILDTGVDCTHPDFMNAGGTSTKTTSGGQLDWPDSDAVVPTTISSPACPWEDDNGHGTLTAGALGAATNNGVGIASLGFPLQLVILKVIDANGNAPDDIVAQGIDWAIINAGAQVISMSLAGPGYSQTLQVAMDEAWQHNVLVVAAAGNGEGTTLTYPGDGNHVLTVAATDTDNASAGFSNYGTWVKIAAPGVNIETTSPTYANNFPTNYYEASGTSMATSFVSALAGLLYAANPDLSAAAIAQRIQQTAQTSSSGWNQYTGCGLINAGAALAGTPGSAIEGSFTGQVVDGSNNPIANALVTAGGQSFTTLTDPTTESATGLFRIANLNPGTYTITVTATGYSSVAIQAVIVAGADTMMTIPMAVALGEFTGSVKYNGVAVAGAAVEALSGNPGAIQGTATTNSSGVYTLYLPAGSSTMYTLLASAPNYNNTTSGTQFLSAGGTVTVNLSLSSLGSLTGTVTDANGVGIANAQVGFTAAGFSGGDITGASGSYSTFGLPSGTYTVTASAPGFSSVSSSGITIATGITTTVNLHFSTGVSLTSGLIGYWTFNEGTGSVAHDQSGNGYNAALSNTTWATGLFSFGLSFNGSNSQGVTSAIPFTNAFSVSAWVNPAGIGQNANAAIAQADSATGVYLGVDSTGTHYKFIVNNGAGSSGSCAYSGVVSGCAQGGTISSGWHLAVGTYDGTTAILYVDGAMAASDTFTPPGNASLALNMGRSYTSGAVWDGILDDMRLYSRALAAEEVSSLFAARSAQTLTLSKTADAAAVEAGTAIGYTLAVTNSGTQAATSAAISDPLPAGSGIGWSISPAYSGPGTCSIAGGTLSCNLGSLAAAAKATVHVASATSTASCGEYVNNASAMATNSASGLASATIGVQCGSSACAVTGDQLTSVLDVQRMINEALGVVAPPLNDLNSDGVVNVADIEIVINSALGRGCTL
jgi:thermitase